MSLWERTVWRFMAARVTPAISAFLIWATPKNAAKIVDLLNEFGFAHSGFRESDFTEPNQVVQLGRAPNRIDLLSSISGVSTDEAFASKVSAELDGILFSSWAKTH